MSSQSVESIFFKLQNERQQEFNTSSSPQTNKPMSSNQNLLKNNKKQEKENKKCHADPHTSIVKQKKRVKTQFWDFQEIQTIFNLYEQYGSQWKIMEAQFIDRTANSIKNRFYTVIRSLLKILFRQHPSILEKLPHEIPSKTILKFYQGREGTTIPKLEFLKFKGLGKKFLKTISYNIQSKQLKQIITQNNSQIIIIYDTIFNAQKHEVENIPKKKNIPSKINSQTNFHQQELNKNEKQTQSPKSYPEDTMKTTTNYHNSLFEQTFNLQTYQPFVFLLPITNINTPQLYPYFNNF